MTCYQLTSPHVRSKGLSQFILRFRAFQVLLVVKNLPANAGDGGDTGSIPGWGRSPEECMATHSSILAWRIPWTEEPGGLQSIGLQRVRHHCSKLACKHVSHIQIKEIIQQNEYKRMSTLIMISEAIYCKDCEQSTFKVIDTNFEIIETQSAYNIL